MNDSVVPLKIFFTLRKAARSCLTYTTRTTQQLRDKKDTTMKLATIALAFALMLPSTLVLANTVRHEPGVGTHVMLHRGVPLTSSATVHPNYGNPNGDPDGPTTLSGTGSSEYGGSAAGTTGYN